LTIAAISVFQTAAIVPAFSSGIRSGILCSGKSLRFYPMRCFLSRRILSAIIAMNSELVGFPRRLWMV
jgi:hypothetical protein